MPSSRARAPRRALPVFFVLFAASCDVARPDSVGPDRTSAGATAAPYAPPAAAPTMRVHFIDVGQGASTLFEFPNGAVLIDTGGESNPEFDSNAALQQYLDKFFARRADLRGVLSSLIVTHPHLDHTRGIATVVENFSPRNVVTNGQDQGSGGAEQQWLHRFAAEHSTGTGAVGFRAIRQEDVPAGGLTDAVIDPVGGLDVDPKISVLWGQVAKDPGWGMDRNRLQFSNANNHCVVVRVEFGQASVLVTGDLQDVAIRDLVKLHASTNALSAVVYEVGHHGSSNGTTPEFLDVMRPRYAVLEVGNPARQDEWTAWQHGHPRKEILAMLEAVLPTSRPVIDVRVGLDKRTFEPRAVSKGIYATGWDGTIVLEAGADGVFRVVSTERTPAGLTRR